MTGKTFDASEFMGFNSTMVRLKVFCREYDGHLSKEFQFHNGSIKSPSNGSTSAAQDLFQFHNGSIKRSESPLQFLGQLQFQFHNGSIKRMAKQLNRPQSFSFNSTMVRLKARKNQQRYYTKPTLFLQGENCLQFQKSSTSGCAKFTGG